MLRICCGDVVAREDSGAGVQVRAASDEAHYLLKLDGNHLGHVFTHLTKFENGDNRWVNLHTALDHIQTQEERRITLEMSRTRMLVVLCWISTHVLVTK